MQMLVPTLGQSFQYPEYCLEPESVFHTDIVFHHFYILLYPGQLSKTELGVRSTEKEIQTFKLAEKKISKKILMNRKKTIKLLSIASIFFKKKEQSHG